MVTERAASCACNSADASCINCVARWIHVWANRVPQQGIHGNESKTNSCTDTGPTRKGCHPYFTGFFFSITYIFSSRRPFSIFLQNMDRETAPPPPEKSNLPDYLPVAQGSPYASSEPFRCASRLRSLNASYAATPPYAPRLSLALADHSGGKGAVVPCIDFIKQSKISTLISQRGRY